MGHLDPVESAEVDADELTGRLRFGLAQYGLLVLLVALVGVIAAVGYESNLAVGRRTEALNDQLQLASGNMVSLEREVLTYAVVVERWAECTVSDEDRELSRSLVERQRRITSNEADQDSDLGVLLNELNEDLATVDALVAEGHGASGSDSEAAIAVAVDDVVRSAKRLFDLTESQDFVLVHALEDGLQRSQRTEWIVAGLIAFFVVALVGSMQRMLSRNYGLARTALRREQSRYEIARAEQARVEYRYREVVDEVSDVVFRCDHRGHWTLLNRAWVTLTGMPLEDALGRQSAEVWHPEDRARGGVEHRGLDRRDPSSDQRGGTAVT